MAATPQTRLTGMATAPSEADLAALFKRDSTVRLEITGGPTPETAAVRLACLALRQAEYWGPADPDLHVPHPRFEEAVGAAAAAPSEQQALEAAEAAADAGGGRREAIAAAITVLGGPEAAAAFGLTT